MQSSLRMLIRRVINEVEIEQAMEFDDWFDFADYTKEENIHGKAVTITSWTYIPRPAEQSP
jgi:hypothetical protein